MSTLHFYQLCKKDESRNDHKVNTGYVWSNRLYNNFSHKLALEIQFESSDDEIDTKDDRTKITNIKEGSNDGNGQVEEPYVETINLPGYDAPQGFVS